MLPESLRSQLTKEFLETFQDQLEDRKFTGIDTTLSADNLHQLKKETIQNFGFEWIQYARFGWDDPIYNIEREEKVFHYKSLLNPDELTGKVVLDAGCGNGRYTYWAAQHADRVIGIDLGDGVESAAENTQKMKNVQIVQGDIFNLPFHDSCIDVIFSIGVLMHTGDAARATASLASKLKPQSSLTVHLYGKGNPIYEFVDRKLRDRTTRMTIQELQHFTNRAYRLRHALDQLHISKLINLFVRLDSHPHCIFDWYAAPIATHHTYEEVEQWFKRLGINILVTNAYRKQDNRFLALLKSFLAAPTVTVRGIRES